MKCIWKKLSKMILDNQTELDGGELKFDNC